MYKDKTFRVRPIPEVLADHRGSRREIPYPIRKVFLADGDALIVKTPDLLTVLDRVFQLFPACRRVTTYGCALDVLGKSHEELCTLREHGLEMVYLGAETGSDPDSDSDQKGRHRRGDGAGLPKAQSRRNQNLDDPDHRYRRSAPDGGKRRRIGPGSSPPPARSTSAC